MEKFQNKYRIPSTRLQHWDYRWAGAYFITICTQNRMCYFGEIANQQMQFSHIGIIADVLWHQIPHHSKNIQLGEFAVMPNHIHGVLIINDNDQTGNTGNTSNNVETGHALSLQSDNQSDNQSDRQSENQSDAMPKSIGQQRFQNIGKNSISSIIGSYKSAVTKHAHRLGFEFQWQSRFHDHIIRDDESFQKISNYIINNPANWQDDKFFNEE